MRTGLLAAGMFVALLVAVIVVIELVRVPQMYAVEGRGEVKYTPDEAEVTSSVYVEGAVSVEAVQEVAATMRDVLAALKATGVSPDDIKTADLRSDLLDVSDVERRTKIDVQRRYYAQQTVTIRVHDIGMIGKILDAIARAGSNYWLVTYQLADRDKLERAARKAALLDAIAVADAYAHDGQFTRGRILKIQDDAVNFPEVDYFNRNYRSNRSPFVGAPIEPVVVTGSRLKDKDTTFDIPPPQEQTVTASTQVLFEID